MINKSKTLYKYFLIFWILTSSWKLYSQDFIIEYPYESSIPLTMEINPNWKNLKEAEAFTFLTHSNFQNITNNYAQGAVFHIGEYKLNNQTIFQRSLIFKNGICIGYNDEVIMTKFCALCAMKLMSGPGSDSFNKSMSKDSKEMDNKMIQHFVEEIKKSFRKDGFPNFKIQITDNSFDVLKKKVLTNKTILRIASLEKQKFKNKYVLNIGRSILLTNRL